MPELHPPKRVPAAAATASLAHAGRYAELWDKDEWLRHVETTDEERRDIAARMSELGL